MRSDLQLLVFLCVASINVQGQEMQPTFLSIGDLAPPLQVRAWIKGAPIQKFESGKVYVVEFWATWCKPCIAAMPYLSSLAAEYKDRVTFLGVDIKEKRTISIANLKAFVDSMGNRMEYRVASEDSNFMETNWLRAFGEQGIPKSFVVDSEGRVAWIGHPRGALSQVLSKILKNTWDEKAELVKRNFKKYLTELDDSLSSELSIYLGDASIPGDLGKPDSALLVINKILRKEPKLKYAPSIAYNTFCALLKTNTNKAYEFGKEVLAISTYEDDEYSLIIDGIQVYSDILSLPGEIYRLGAEMYQTRIDNYPENIDMPYDYDRMAEWYWRACDKAKAIEAEQKAIEVIKNKKEISKINLASLESRLLIYKKMENSNFEWPEYKGSLRKD